MTSLDARPRLVHCRLRTRGDRTLLVAAERGLVLGGSAPTILALVDGRRTVAEVVDALVAAHPVSRDRVERDVLALIDALATRGFVHTECP